MKKMAVIIIAVFLSFGLFSSLAPVLVFGGGWHGGWGYGWGPRFYWGGSVAVWPFPYFYYPYYYPYYASPPVVIQQQPQVYSEPVQQPYYWYYCQNPQGYYPYVKSCPGGWMKVEPHVAPPSPGEEDMTK
jgi:hypothetical protein